MDDLRLEYCIILVRTPLNTTDRKPPVADLVPVPVRTEIVCTSIRRVVSSMELSLTRMSSSVGMV